MSGITPKRNANWKGRHPPFRLEWLFDIKSFIRFSSPLRDSLLVFDFKPLYLLNWIAIAWFVRRNAVLTESLFIMRSIPFDILLSHFAASSIFVLEA